MYHIKWYCKIPEVHHTHIYNNSINTEYRNQIIAGHTLRSLVRVITYKLMLYIYNSYSFLDQCSRINNHSST